MPYSTAPSRVWAAVALVASLAWPAGPARAGVQPPEGPGDCGWSGTADSTQPGGDRWIHVFHAGPLAVIDDDVAANPVFATVTCSLSEGWLHTSPVIAAATSAPSPGIVVLPPTLVVAAPVPDDAIVVLCLRVDVVGGPSFYSNGAGGWTTDANSSCITALPPSELPPREVFDLLDTVTQLSGLADGTICPALAGLAPGTDAVTIDATGDTYVAGQLLWDCPPYQT